MTKTKTTSPTNAAAGFARTLVKKQYGTCTVVRALATKFPQLPRHDVMAIAAELELNPHTTSRQFHLVRSGAVAFDMATL